MQRTLSAVRFIVNADDFGLTPGVNRAVHELVQAGALTSATLMASGGAFPQAACRSVTQPGFGVGCHVVLVDGAPVSTGGIPTLRGRRGLLHESLTHFLLDLQSERISEEEIEREAVAQITRLQSAGLHVTHVDTHKHTHLFPRVARPLIRAAASCGVYAVRNPFEPEWSARLTRGTFLRTLEVRALRGFQSSFKHLCHEFGMRTTDGSLGVSATGRLDGDALRSLIDGAQPGTWELVCHPGYQDTALNTIKTRLRGTREIERQALLDQIPRAILQGRVQAISFGDL